MKKYMSQPLFESIVCFVAKAELLDGSAHEALEEIWSKYRDQIIDDNICEDVIKATGLCLLALAENTGGGSCAYAILTHFRWYCEHYDENGYKRKKNILLNGIWFSKAKHNPRRVEVFIEKLRVFYPKTLSGNVPEPKPNDYYFSLYEQILAVLDNHRKKITLLNHGVSALQNAKPAEEVEAGLAYYKAHEIFVRRHCSFTEFSKCSEKEIDQFFSMLQHLQVEYLHTNSPSSATIIGLYIQLLSAVVDKELFTVQTYSEQLERYWEMGHSKAQENTIPKTPAPNDVEKTHRLKELLKEKYQNNPEGTKKLVAHTREKLKQRSHVESIESEVKVEFVLTEGVCTYCDTSTCRTANGVYICYRCKDRRD